MSILHRYSVILLWLLSPLIAIADHVDSLKSIAEDLNQAPATRMESYYGIATGEFRNHTADALSAGHEALALALHLQDTSYAGKSHNIIGICHSIFSQYDSAVYHFHKALYLGQTMGNPRLRARALQNLGIVSYHTGELEDAIGYYGRVETQLKDLNDSAGLSKIYTNLGNVSWQKGEPWEALKYYHQSLNLKEALGDSARIPIALTNIAIIYLDLENFPQALSLFNQCLLVYEKHEDQIGISTVFSNMGETYLRMQDYENANRYFLYALAVQEELGLTQAIARTHTHLADIHAKMGETEHAIALFESSACEQIEIEDYMGLAGTYHGWTEVLMELEQWDKALAIGYNSLEATQQSGVVQDKINSYKLLAQLYQEKANWDSLYFYAHEMERLVHMHDLARFNQEAYELLASHAEHEGNYPQAYGYLKQVQQIERENEAFKLKGSQIRREIQYWTDRAAAAKVSRQQARLAEAQLELFRTQSAQGWIITLMLTFIISTLILACSYYLIRKNHRILKRQQEDLSHKNEELAKLHKEHTHLLGVITHGMRTPVSQIEALTQIVGAEHQDLSIQKRKRFLSAVKQATAQLSHHIDQVLKLNSLESQVTKWHMEDVHITQLLIPMVERLTPVLHQKSLTIEQDFPNPSCTGFTDPEQLAIVVDNLLSNAIKFSSPDTTITVGTRYVPGREEVRIFVKDQGPGIKPQEISRIFDKYTRLSNKPTQGEPSTGLGLAIVKANMQEMGGRVWVESIWGQGATFWLALPARHPQEIAVAASISY